MGMANVLIKTLFSLQTIYQQNKNTVFVKLLTSTG